MEQKLKVMTKYKGGMTLSAIAKITRKAVSTINIIAKDRERIRDSTKGSMELGVTIIFKRRQSPIVEMEKHLVRWMHDLLAAKNKSLNLSLIQGSLSLPGCQKTRLGLRRETLMLATAGFSDSRSAFQ